MPRPLGSKNRPGSKKPGPKPGSKNKTTLFNKRHMEALIAGSSKRVRIEPGAIGATMLTPGTHSDINDRGPDNEDVSVDVGGDGGIISIDAGNEDVIDVECVAGRLAVATETVATATVEASESALAQAVACSHPSDHPQIEPGASVGIATDLTCEDSSGYVPVGRKLEEVGPSENDAERSLEVMTAPVQPVVSELPVSVSSSPNGIEQAGDTGENVSVEMSDNVELHEDSKTTEITGQRTERPVRLSPAMRRHVASIKQKIDANMRHKGGRAAPTKPGLRYPFDGPLILPGCSTIGHGAGSPDVSRFYLKAVFAWVPEYLWPEQVHFVPCPNCGSAGKPDGWTPQQPRRSFMEHGIAYIIGFRYKCSACAEFNKSAIKTEKRTTSYHAWDPACLGRLPDSVSREYPFIPTRKSAMHIRLIDRLAHDLISGKGFAATANYIRQAYVSAFSMDKAKYETLAESCRRAMANSSSADESTISPGEVFGSFDDVLKYSGAAPTEPYLRHVWRIWFADLSVKSPNISWTQEDYQYRVLRLWDGPPSTAHHGGTPKQAYVRTGERDDLRMLPPDTESNVSGEKPDTHPHPHPHPHSSGEENVAMGAGTGAVAVADAGAGAGAGADAGADAPEAADNITPSAGAAEQCASRPRWLPNMRECRPAPTSLGLDDADIRPRVSTASTSAPSSPSPSTSTSTQVTQGETRQEETRQGDDTHP